MDKNEIHVEIPEKLPDTIDQDSMWKWFRKRKLSGKNAFRVSKVCGLTASRVRVSGGCCNVDVMQQVIDIIILMKSITRYWWRLIFWLILWRMAYRKKQL